MCNVPCDICAYSEDCDFYKNNFTRDNLKPRSTFNLNHTLIFKDDYFTKSLPFLENLNNE